MSNSWARVAEWNIHINKWPYSNIFVVLDYFIFSLKVDPDELQRNLRSSRLFSQPRGSQALICHGK